MTLDANLAYRQASGEGATPVRRVILLYEQIVQDLQKALEALDANEIEQRSHKIDHALLIIGELQSRLDMERGGEVSRNLERFYNVLRARLLEAQLRGSREILLKQISDVMMLRSAWLEVEQAIAEKPVTLAATAARPMSKGDVDNAFAAGAKEWNA